MLRNRSRTPVALVAAVLAVVPQVAPRPAAAQVADHERVREALDVVEVWLEAQRAYEQIPALSAAVVHDRGYRVVNVDVTVVCETPKIGPHAEGMAGRLGDALSIPPGRVSVKGKTNEGLGWIGKGEGLAVHAVALLEAGGEVSDGEQA